MNRQALVARYLQLVSQAEREFGMTRLPQIKTYMSDAEIVRLGQDLAAKLKDAAERVEEHKKLLGE